MFCPKCGSQLPDGAQFCNKCGNQLSTARRQAASRAPETAQPAQPAQPAPQANNPFAAPASGASNVQSAAPRVRVPSSTASFSGVGIAARVAAVLTMICMFLPWLSVPFLRKAGDALSTIGIRSSAESDFAIFNMDTVTKALDAMSRSNGFSTIHMIFLVAWGIALIAIIVGLVRSFVSGNKTAKPIILGGIIAAAVAILWFIAITVLNGEFSRQLSSIGLGTTVFEVPIGVFLTILLGVGTVVLSAMDNK